MMIDSTTPKHMEIRIRHDGKVVWINIDGKCELRACQIGELSLLDDRNPTKETE